jgi:ATP-dependent DNA helicase RecQ
VVADIHEQLSADLTLRGTLDRESLRLSVLSLPSHSATLAWLAEHLPELPGSGIIYTLTVSAAEELAAFLTEQGFPVSAYTGKTEATEREATEADLINNDVKALVATSALGMGFDKPDLGFVIHVGAPSSPVAYYQQIGRAGRGVERAEVLLLPSKADQDIWSYFDGLSFPKQHIVEQLLDVLNDAGRPLSIPAIEPHVELSRSRIEATLKVLDVDGAVSRSKSGWSATGQGWTYDAKRYANLSAARTHEQQLMLEYQQIPGCRMEFLRRTLDDPEAAPCGRCDNCTGTRRSDKVSADRITSARTSLDKPGVTIVARRMWPTGLEGIGIPLKGKISASAQPEDGKTVGRLTDIAWGNQLRQLFRDQGPEVVASADLVKASIRVLAEWQWKARPVGIVFIESASRPELSRDLAHQLSTIGRLPMLGSVHSFGGTVSNVNSAQRLAAVYRNLSLSHETIKAVQAAPGPILLIDDLIDSGWTMTVATHLLRQHCDVPILPFALASTN